MRPWAQVGCGQRLGNQSFRKTVVLLISKQRGWTSSTHYFSATFHYETTSTGKQCRCCWQWLGNQRLRRTLVLFLSLIQNGNLVWCLFVVEFFYYENE